MNSTVKYSVLFTILLLLILYIAIGQVTSVHTRRADYLMLDWVSIQQAPDTLMGQTPGFESGPFVFVEHVDVEITDDGSIYTANNSLRRLNPGGGIAWESSVVIDEGIVPTAVYFRDVYIEDTGDIYALGHLRYFLNDESGEVTDEQVMTMFFTKHSPDGALLWQKIWNDETSGRVWGTDIITDPDGNPVIIGNYELSIDFDPGDGYMPGINVSNPKLGGDPEEKLDVDDYDAFALRLTPDGDFINVITWSGSVYCSTSDSEGNFIVAGNNLETGDEEEVGMGCENFSPDTYFAAIGADFEDINIITPDESLRNILIRDFDLDNDGNIYAVGSEKCDDSINGVVCRLTPDFELDWIQKFGETDKHVFPLSVDVALSGEIYIAGGFASISEDQLKSLDFDPGKGKDLHAGPFYEIFITRYHADGEYGWTGSFGGDRHDWAGSIQVDSDGKIFVLGYFQNSVDFDPSPRDLLQSTQSDIGAYLVQFSEWRR